MRQLIVKPGDCMSSIAAAHGWADAKKLLAHPENASLRQLRQSPDLLFPGDVVSIPDPKPVSVKLATGRRHEFRVLQPRKRLHLRLRGGDGEPLAAGPFELRFASGSVNGEIKSDGCLEAELPASVHEALLCIGNIRRRLLIGHLNPMTETSDQGVSGAQGRLANLGYAPGPVDGVVGPRTRAALRRFQAAHDLSVTGTLDEQTRRALEKEHGC